MIWQLVYRGVLVDTSSKTTSDIGFNSVINTNDFGGGVNTFTIDLKGLENEVLLIIIYRDERMSLYTNWSI